MSETTFQVGDEVEVLPCTEGGGIHEAAHCQVTGRRGTVLIVREGARTVGVHFPGLCGNNLFGKITTTTGWWCDRAWLRRVPAQEPPRTVPHGKAGCPCACCRYAFRCAVLGHPEKDPGADSPSPAHDAPSRPQDARSAPEPQRAVPQGTWNEASGGKAKLDVEGINVKWTFWDAWPGPRYRVGDLVDMGRFPKGKVLDVDAEPRYSVQWPDGHVQRIKESTLRPHEAAPAKCAPDGTRCSRADEWGLSVNWTYCPHCGGRLKEG